MAHVAPKRTAWASEMRRVNRQYEGAVTDMIQQGIDEGSIKAVGEPWVLAYGSLELSVGLTVGSTRRPRRLMRGPSARGMPRCSCRVLRPAVSPQKIDEPWTVVNIDIDMTSDSLRPDVRSDGCKEVRRTVTALRTKLRESGTKDDSYWSTEMLTRIYSADAIIYRGEDLFFDEDNPVEIAAARQRIIDLDTVADKLSPSFKQDHPEIPWIQLANTRDKLAHHDDNMNRDIVWNVLVGEFPKIRRSLRQTLNI